MIQNIQALRAVAALLVVFVHLGQLLEAFGARAFGDAGVDLFFVISGFVMVRATRGRDTSPRRFMVDRITRIVPLYWLFTVGVFGLAVAAPSLVQASRADVGELLKSLLFVPFVKSNGLVQPMLFVGWTLNYEMFFYALFALGLTFRRYYLGLALTGGVILVLVSLGWLLKPTDVLGRFYTDPIMLEFLLGMGLALALERAKPHASSSLSLLTALLILAALVAAVVFPLTLPQLPRVIASGLPAAIVVGGAVMLERWGWRVESPLWMTLGAASYALYLSHPFVTQIVQKFGMRLAPTELGAVALTGVAIVGVSAVACALHLGLERPLTRLVRGEGWKTPLPAVS